MGAVLAGGHAQSIAKNPPPPRNLLNKQNKPSTNVGTALHRGTYRAIHRHCLFTCARTMWKQPCPLQMIWKLNRSCHNQCVTQFWGPFTEQNASFQTLLKFPSIQFCGLCHRLNHIAHVPTSVVAASAKFDKCSS